VVPVLVTVAAHVIAGLTGVAVTVNVPLPDAPQLLAVTAPQFVVVVSAGSVGAAVSHCKRRPATAPDVSALYEATCAFVRALDKLTRTTDAKIPIMAMTMRSSIRVNPFCSFFICSPPSYVCFYFYLLSSSDLRLFYILFLYLTSKVIDRQENTYHQYSYSDTKKDYQNRLDEDGEASGHVFHFLVIEFLMKQ
jgi:hypothetical protein